MGRVFQFFVVLTVCSACFATSLRAAVVAAEYFMGEDPGPGNGVSLSLDSASDLGAQVESSMVSIVGETAGTYRVGLRVQDEAGRWSNPVYRSFTLVSSEYTLSAETNMSDEQLVAAEVFIGEDPGEGQGVPLAVNAVSLQSGLFLPETLDLTALSPGVYRISVRVQNGAGKWSAPISRSIEIVASTFSIPTPPVVPTEGQVSAEVFIGADPGAGNGVVVALADAAYLSAHLEAANLDLEGLEPGTYRVGVRLKDADGNWGHPIFRSYRIEDNAFAVPVAPALPAERQVSAEIFVGEDPGEGNGVPAPLTSLTHLSGLLEALDLDLTTLPPGTHAVGVRIKDVDGQWSRAQARRFTILSSEYGVSAAPLVPDPLTYEAEYFVGSDPGEGACTVLTLASQSQLSSLWEAVSADISALSPGDHEVGVRVRADGGAWSQPLFRRFTVKSAELVSKTGESYAQPIVPVDIQTQWEIRFASIPQNIAYKLTIDGQELAQWGRIGETPEAFLLRLETALTQHPLFGELLLAEYDAGVGALKLKAIRPGRLDEAFITVEAPFELEKTVEGGLSDASRAIVAAEFFVNNDPGGGRGLPIQINILDSIISAVQSKTATVDLLARYEEQGTVLIDFGDDLVWQSASVDNPDTRGHYWNSVRPATTYLNLVDTSEADTGIGMILGSHGGDSYNGPAGDVTVNGPEDSDYDVVALGLLAEDKAVFDYISGIANTALGRFSLTGLDPQKTYDIVLFGSKKYIQDGGDGTTVYRVYSDAGYSDLLSETELVVGSASDVHNRDTLSYLRDLTPNASGELYFEFGGKVAWTEGYLNAMSITYGGGRQILGLRAGDHRVGVRFQNASGNWSTPIYRTFKSTLAEGLPDTEPPVITLLGDSPLDWPYGVPFVDPGFTVLDDVDGDLTDYTVGPDPVNVFHLGEHTLRYEAMDSAGNLSAVERLVRIVDDSPPRIIGFDTIQRVAASDTIDYYDGLRVSDVAYGDLTHALRIRAGLVAPNFPGFYSVAFEVRDPAGNISTFIRTYEIIEEGQYPPYSTWIAESAVGTEAIEEDLLEAADPDGDGHSNFDEWLAGTDPFVQTSYLKVNTIRVGDDVVLQWTGAEGIQYWIEEATDLENWARLSTKAVMGEAPEMQRLIDLSQAGNEPRFYRLRSEPVGVMQEVP